MIPIKSILIKQINLVEQRKSPFTLVSRSIKVAYFPLNTKTLLYDIRTSVRKIVLTKKNNAGMM